MSELQLVSTPQAVAMPEPAPEQVEAYLRQHPDFLQTREELLTQMNFPQSSGGTLSLAARQAEIMREKIRVSERSLHELHVQAHANEQRAQKIHHLSLLLLRAAKPDEALQRFTERLVAAFDLAGALLQLNLDSESALVAAYPSLTDFSHKHGAWSLLSNITTPTIPRMNNELRELLRKHHLPETGSTAVVPFRIGSEINPHGSGVLLLVKREPQGFSPDMGGLFLEQLGALLAATFERHCSAID
ncbi:MAG: DUF484 family protein [Pseudomonadota bacterium]